MVQRLQLAASDVAAALGSYPTRSGPAPRYGTAGFRGKAIDMAGTTMRCGIIAGMRALEQGAIVGIMITASHNPEPDNGIKLVDPTGDMLSQAWEAHATSAAQCADSDALHTCLSSIISAEAVPVLSEAPKKSHEREPCVFIGRDTRPSSPQLEACAAAGAALTGVGVQMLGICTTPMLHYAVREQRDGSFVRYFAALREGFAALTTGHGQQQPAICIIDCANGVGALAATHLQATIPSDTLQLYLCNAGALADPRLAPHSHGALNDGCGSDYLQTKQQWPANMVEAERAHAQALCCSVDGDADRILFCTDDSSGVHCFAEQSSSPCTVLDGDYIAALIAGYLSECIRAAGLEKDLSIGVVQTAYANGASTAYLSSSLKLTVALACTGVKHLHAAAAQFDVGVYFEANGHGSVVFSKGFYDALHTACAEGHPKLSEGRKQAARELHAVTKVINPAIGDAMSGMLLVAAVLKRTQMTVRAWAQLFSPLASRLATVRVTDRHVITTTSMETRVRAPAQLQDDIDTYVAASQQGRAFVRPSGTEDVVRVYAEAATQSACDTLCLLVMQAVHRHARGLGEAPQCVQ